MKRFAMFSLAVLMLAGVANAQPAVWLADKADGDGHIQIVGPSNTGVIQLWLQMPDRVPNTFEGIIGMDAILTAYNNDFSSTDVSFDVVGFNEQVLPTTNWDGSDTGGHGMQVVSHGAVEGQLPNGDINVYQYIGDDQNFDENQRPYGDGGLQQAGTFLLDEIIIHCTGVTEGAPDYVYFEFPPAQPGYFQLIKNPLPPPGNWAIGGGGDLILNNGTFSAPFLVENLVPEPATLGLLVLGGLAVLRRR